ncbi:hypothetical protein WH7805_00710 [Synechococcus sp. WH 7805]|uniref:hypothetical protein n=1 Tax=unclassified Synechococcus TaxID=2626047 RepID=UPI00006ADB43|nr:hypothetical protein [Synechococcus sp. WH 7805]EAR17590.1 hypothetical protein WH7805_00710 [Synechococcus sp. WH 7805]
MALGLTAGSERAHDDEQRCNQTLIAPVLITENGSAVEEAVDRLSSSVFPQATLAQLLATLLVVGVLALAVGVPIARRRRHVRQFEQRIREREDAPET